MATGSITNPVPDPLKYKQVYEKALTELNGESEKDARRAMPIYQRRLSPHAGDPGKRALAEAADALSALWRGNSRKGR